MSTTFPRHTTSVHLAFALAWLVGASAPATVSAVSTVSVELADVRVEAVATGLGSALAVTHAGDARLFVATLTGQILIVENDQVKSQAFLNIGNLVFGQGFGLFGLAFHPNYAENGFFFVHYTGKDSELVIARYKVSGDDPNRADPASGKILLSIAKEQRLHYGGQLAFGPDGYLYASTGDGTGDGRLVDPRCAAQSLTSLEGKILRLDVDRNVDQAPYYGVPEDNPFVGVGLGEIWAHGLRNPWRFSFDQLTGDLWLTDVGQDRREEINLQLATSTGGENYGWKVMEGHFCLDNRVGCPASLPPCDDASLTPPVIQYSHSSDRCAAIGGGVYRGRIVELRGRYLYGDFCTGEVWAARASGSTWVSDPLSFTLPSQTFTSMGEDASGEMWVTTTDTLYRLVGPDPPVDTSECVADATHLCLNQGRFEVSVTWRTANQSGSGQAVTLGEDSGSFWFFSANNPEIFVKLLDACSTPFNRYWVFAAGLTDVETSLRVVDTETGEVRHYDRPAGVPYVAVQDTDAFATCP